MKIKEEEGREKVHATIRSVLSRKTKAVAILVFAGILLATAMISPVAAQDNVSGIYDEDGANDVVPGETYIAYNFTYTDPSDPAPGDTNLTWFNITGWNNSVVTNNVTFDDISNITLWNATTPTNLDYIGHNNSTWAISDFNISVNLSDYWVPNGTKANVTVNITMNTTGLVDGEQIAFNATLRYLNTSSGNLYTEWANDTHVETIEVLNATAGTSNTTAWEGNTNVLCANVTIEPGNKTVTQYLKKITINNTATAPRIDPAYIESFGLWNNSDANGFNPTLDFLISTSAPTEGSNVTFNLTNLALDNRTILATGGTFFLTMNITKPAHNGKYQAEIFPQNITINQTAGEGNTGNSSDTVGFTTLWIDPADVYMYNSPEDLVSPGKSYIAYNVTYQEDDSSGETTGANLTWFNVTEMNQSIANIGNIDDIVNVSVWNATDVEYLGHNNTRGSASPYFAVNLSNETVANNATYKLSINLTINNSAPVDPWDGTNTSINATQYDNETHALGANDTAPELIAYESVDDPTDAVITWNETTYYPDSTAGISVFDPDYDTLTDSNQTIVVRAWTDTAGNATSGYEEVELAETGNTSGRFNGSVTFDPIADSHANDVLAVRNGDQLYVQMKDNQDQDGVVAYSEETAWFNFTRTGTIDLNKTIYNTSEAAKVTVKDKDENTDSTSIEIINNVNVNSSTDLTGITLSLTETTISSGEFEGTFDFTTTEASSGTTLNVTRNATHTVNETINVTYFDAKTAAGTAENATANATFFGLWTGDVSLNESVYKDESALNVTLYDPDLNYPAERTYVTNASNYTLMFINTTDLTAYSEDPSSYDSEDITNVTEYIGDTGWFMNDTIPLNTTNTSSVKDDGVLYVAPGESFAACYFDYNDSYGTNYSIYAPDDVANCTDYATASTLETAAVSVWWNETGNISGTVINVTSDNVWGKDTVARISIDDADGGGIDLTDAPDNISVNVNSTENTTGIDINLTETGVNTGVFNGTLMFGTESSAATRTIEVNSNDSELVNTVIGVNFNDTENVTAGIEWGNVSFTHWWSVNGTAKIKNGTEVWGTPTSNVIFYNTTTATVQVTDSDRNNDTSIYNNFTVTMVSWNASKEIDTLDLLLNETGNNTGMFSNASLNFSEAGDPLKLNVSDGCYINISYNDTNTSLGNVSTWFNDTYGTYKKTRTGTVGLWELNPTVGESGNITLTDYDRNVTAGYDTVNVDVWSNTSEAESETITVTLNQTSPTAETFNGTLRFSTAESNESNNQIQISDGDNVTIKYVDPLNRSGLQETFTNNSAWVVVRYSGAVTFDKTRYNPTETALITLSDQDLNAETGIAETRTVNVNSSAYGTGITVTLKETGANTGIFNRTITFTLAPSPANESGRIINVTIGGTINVTYVDAVNETGATDVNIIANAGIVKATTDVLSLDRTYYNAAATATINVTDADLNTDSELAEVYNAGTSPWSNVSVNSSSDLTGFNVSIEETGDNTGIFFGTFTFNTTIAASDATNKILKVANNDTINITYINTKNVTGAQETMVKSAIFDNEEPSITDLDADKDFAKNGTVVTITFNATDAVSSIASTSATVNGNPANYSDKVGSTYTYNYNVTTADTEELAWINVTATDNATNVDTDENNTLLTIDLSAPTFSGWTPAESTVVNATTTISVNYTDAYSNSSINASSVVMKVNGEDVTEAITATGVSYAATNLPDGKNNASVSVADELGQSNTTLWNFTVDENPPVITGEIPNKTNSTQPTIGATITDLVTGVNASTIVLKVDGSTIPSTAWDFVYDSANKTGDLTYITPTTISYSETKHTVELNVRDNANLLAQASWNFTVDLTNPTVSVGVDKDTVNVSENVTIAVTASDTVTEAESMIVTATVDTTSVSLTSDGSNWTGVFASDVADTYTVTAKATDEAGNSATDMTPLKVLAPANVTVTGLDVVEDPVVLGANVTINVTVHNYGEVSNGLTANVSIAKPDNTTDYVEIEFTSVAANATVTNSETYTPAAAGSYTATADGFSDTFTVTSVLMEGDVDMNGCVDISDALLIARYDVELEILTADQLTCGDTNDDGVVDISDAMHIAQYDVDPDGSLGVLYMPLWESPADDDMLEPVPC